MDIRFCDFCNESVPKADIAAGRAYEARGRLVCVDCDAAMGERSQAVKSEQQGEPATPPRTADVALNKPQVQRHGGSSAATWLGAMALLALAGLFGYGMQRIAAIEASMREQGGERHTDLTAELQRISAKLADDSGPRDAFRSRTEYALTGVDERLDALVAEAAERELGAASREAALLAKIDELRDELAATAVDTARVASMERGLDQARADLEVLARSVLDAMQPDASGSGGSLQATRGVEASELPPDAPAWAVHLPLLESDDAGVRWDAIERFAHAGDPLVTPHLIPLLGDEDLFVRMAAARVLGELRSSDAVPDLIEALLDGEPSVRESAMLSLRAITGRQFGFEPDADEKARGRSVDDWREWWQSSGDAPTE